MTARFALTLTISALQLGAVGIGQIQTFDNSNSEWVIGVGPGGGTPTPVPRAFGGPGGPADPYLSIEALGGGGPRSRLAAQNYTMWTGDYIAAGVNKLFMDVNNFGTTELSLRLLFVQFGALGPVSAAFTTVPVVVAANSGWQSVQFNIMPSDLTGLSGPPWTITDPATTLANVGELRIFHNVAAAFPPDPVVAQLGVDNIATVPEPGTVGLAAAGLILAAVARLRKRTS